MNQTQPIRYDLNTEAAKEGSGNTFSSIDKSGAYKGVITRAEFIIAGTGATGVELDFESTSKVCANFIKLYTYNANGEEILGYKKLMALMTCLRLRNIPPVQRTIKKYDSAAKQEIPTQAFIYPDLMGKPIGLVLQLEEYLKQSNDIGYKINLCAPFDASTNQTAREILENKPAESLEKIIASIKDKKLSDNYQNQNSQTSPQQTSQGYSQQYQYDDDIPF